MGFFVASYILTDPCGNADTCHTYLTVLDKSAPIAICDQFTKVTLGIDGTARLNAISLDDGSTDNCQIHDMKIAKMTDACSQQVLQFNDYVQFCCNESNKEVMVVFRVTDFSGNSNSCMVTVKVEDKLPPVIHCPDNLTISCQLPYDINNLNNFGSIASGASNVHPIIINDAFNNGIAGYDGYWNDNCIATITTSAIDSTFCHQGKLIRNFVATDANGNSSSCKQYITALNPDPFDFGDIVFPSNIEINACNPSAANPLITGKPTFTNTGLCQCSCYLCRSDIQFYRWSMCKNHQDMDSH